MPQQLFLPNIKGLIPLIDRRKVAEPYVVEGQNFIMDADGPLSGLGRTVLSHKAIYTLGNIQTFKIAETLESFIVNNEGIFRFDTESGETILLDLFTAPVISEFPWSMAAVGNKYYFAREGSSLIEYDIFNDLWTTRSGGSIPTNIYACAESDGRLILLTDLWAAWSAIGDGTNFTSSTSTGAGAQALTKLGLSNPKPLGIKAVDDGFLTFLSSGIMKSQSILAINPYRHTILSKKHSIINPYCLTTDESDSVIFLTKAGLYKTTGGKPQQWEQAMGEYFHTSILPNLDIINNQNSIQLDFDYDRSWFFICIAESQVDYQYTKAFLLNTKIGQWGALNTPFIALANFYTLPTTFEGFIYGLIDNEGSILRFDGSNGVEQVPILDDGYTYWHQWEEIPARNVDDVITFTIHGAFATESKLNYDLTGTYYRYNEVKSIVSPVDLTSEEKAPTFEYLNVFTEEFADISLWTIISGSATYTFPLNGLDSSPVANVDGYSSAWLTGFVTHNPANLYKITVRIRQTSLDGFGAGENNAFVGLQLYDSGMNPIGFAWCCILDKCMDDFLLNSWQTFTGYYQGEGTFADPSDDLNNPAPITAGTAFVKPYYQVNFLFGTGVMEIDYITIDDLTQDYLIFKTNTTFAAGLTELKETKQDPNLNSLNSYVTIGPIRVFNEEDSDRYSYINNLVIGTLSGAVGDTTDDWNDPNKYPVDLIEDWNALTGEEDWGFGASSSVDYSIEMISTLDAKTPLPDFVPSVHKVNTVSSSDYYVCDTSGVYHLIKITALEASQNYHIKTLDLSANLGGRL